MSGKIVGALYAFKERRGDCTEYMSLATAVFRVNNVPARAVAGFVVEEGSAVLSSGDYHNWTEFYDGQGVANARCPRINYWLKSRNSTWYSGFCLAREVSRMPVSVSVLSLPMSN